VYGQNCRREGAEERNSELEDRTVEITESEQQRGNRLKRTEQFLRHPWDYNKRSDVYVMRSLERGKREGLKNYWKK